MPLFQDNPNKYNITDLPQVDSGYEQKLGSRETQDFLSPPNLLVTRNGVESARSDITTIFEFLDYPMDPGESIYLGLDGDPAYGDHPVSKYLNEISEQMADPWSPLGMASWWVFSVSNIEGAPDNLYLNQGSGVLKDESGVLRFQTIGHVADNIVNNSDGRLVIGVPGIGFYLVSPNWYRTNAWSNEPKSDNSFYYFDLEGPLLANMLWEIENGNLQPFIEVDAIPDGPNSYYYRPDVGYFVPPVFEGVDFNDDQYMQLKFKMHAGNGTEYWVCKGMSGGAVVFEENGAPSREMFGQIYAVDHEGSRETTSGGFSVRRCNSTAYAIASNPEYARNGEPVETQRQTLIINDSE